MRGEDHLHVGGDARKGPAAQVRQDCRKVPLLGWVLVDFWLFDGEHETGHLNLMRYLSNSYFCFRLSRILNLSIFLYSFFIIVAISCHSHRQMLQKCENESPLQTVPFPIHGA